MSVNRTYSADAIPTARTVPVKRRNGKLQSCEPCRRRKLSCDHRIPVCSRCIRRGHANDCYYHPAPMTRPRESLLPSPSQSNISSPSAATTTSHPRALAPPTPIATQTQTPGFRSESVPPANRLQEILSVPSAGILMESSTARRTVGFLGETSSTAVVAELNSSLGIQTPQGLDEPRKEGLSEDYLRSGAEVLAFFENADLIEALMDRWLKLRDSFLMYQTVYTIWMSEMIPIIRNLADDKGLESLAALLWCNTQHPLVHTSNTTVLEWALQATGQHLRWESLGMVLSVIGTLASSLPQWDPVFKGSYPRPRLMKTVLKLVNICVDLSKRCGSRNDLLMCLLYERVMITAYVHGDTSSEVWITFGEVCDTTILLGLHLGSRVDSTPFFLGELRNRIFNVVYSMDKFLATFLGRPPRISYRYSVVKFPCDLSDHEICMDLPAIQRRLSELELTGGYSTTGKPMRSCWRRAWSNRHTIREDILEIVIGPHSIDLEARLSYIRAREKEAYDALPAFCQVDPEVLIADLKRNHSLEMPGRGVEWDPHNLQCLVAIHTGIRHADFLLERAVANRTKSDSSRLIQSARSLLKLVLQTFTMKDYLSEFQIDMTDMLAFNAVPPAGVLAIEMLKRDQMNEPYDTFPRSETLQQLSILVPALEAVRPDEGNYSICNMGLNAIKKVLDRLLSKPPGRALPLDSGHALLDDAQFGVTIGNDADFLQWLGSVDFDTNGWLEAF